MIVAGTFKTGIENYDRVNALVDIRLIQRLNNWTNREIGGYEIFIKDYSMADSVSNRIFDKLPRRWNSQSITEIYGSLFDWLNLQDTTIIIVIVIMVLVAILNLVTCLIILLLERTRMIGLLKSLGSRDRTIQQVFLYHGALITFGGIIAGQYTWPAFLLAPKQIWIYHFAGRILLYFHRCSKDQLAAGLLGESWHVCNLLYCAAPAQFLDHTEAETRESNRI